MSFTVIGTQSHPGKIAGNYIGKTFSLACDEKAQEKQKSVLTVKFDVYHYAIFLYSVFQLKRAILNTGGWIYL